MDVGLVCDACSALTPIGVPQCARCGAGVALDPKPVEARTIETSKPPPAARSGPGPIAGARACASCAANVAPGQRFCPNCGTEMPAAPSPGFDVETRVGPRPAVSDGRVTPSPSAKVGRSTLFFGGVVQSSRAKLTLIRGDGEDGVSFTLAGQEHHAGRGDCPISFPDDPFLSPTHANFLYRANGTTNDLVVRDEDSLNGVFVRISGTAELASGSTVLVGEQVLTVQLAAVPEDAPDADGTYFSASMPRPAAFEVKQSLRGGATGGVFRVRGESVVLGREGNDINFPEDPFISERHAELRIVDGVLSVTDLQSRNGTFVRVNGERVLRHGDYVFLGQQLLRVEIV